MGKLTNIKLGSAIRNHDSIGREEADDFRKLLEAEWTELISSRALTSLKEMGNKVHVLPLTNDLLILRNFPKTEIKKEVAAEQSNSTNESWIRLC